MNSKLPRSSAAKPSPSRTPTNPPNRNASSHASVTKMPSPTLNATQTSDAANTSQRQHSSSPIVISREEILTDSSQAAAKAEQRRPASNEIQPQFVRKNSPSESPTHSASPTSSGSVSKRKIKEKRTQPAITIRVPQAPQVAELRRHLSETNIQRSTNTQKTDQSSRQSTPPPSPPSERSELNLTNLTSSLKNSHYMQSTRSLLKTTSVTQDTSEEESRAVRHVQIKDTSTARRVAEFVQACLRRPIEEIVDEYGQLQGVVPTNRECLAYHKDVNAKKNRYKDIRCIDATRVKLWVPGGDEYIHANWVTGRLLRNRFIVTQGPLSRTTDDFWRMVWQEKCVLIFMLCNNIEEKRKKCHEYLPECKEEKDVSGIRIRISGVVKHKRDTLIETRLALRCEGKTLNVTHWKWIGWQDFKVPLNDFQTPLRLLRMAREAKGCTVVHCSAGVGRSGTLVALEICLMELVNGNTLNVKECVERLRHQRANSVQTAPQYLFLYRSLLEFALNNNIVRPEQIEPFHRMYLQFIKRSYAL